MSSSSPESSALSFGSLFAGVGGADLGFEAAGLRCAWQVENDPACQQVLKHHWPDVPLWSDISEVNGANLPPVDVIVFGSPCQDLSVAGRRQGFDGERSALFFEATRIIKEMRDATETSPRWAVWENVPGALSSSKGEDFGAAIDELAKVGALVIEWAVLDAQHFGVPQRRRRVFTVACFDPALAGRCGQPLLPVPDSGGGNPSQGKAPRQGDASTTGEGADSSSDEDSPDQLTFRMLGFGHYVDDDITSPVQSRDWKYPTDLISEPFVKSRRAQSKDDPETWVADAPNPTLNAWDHGDSRTTTAVVFTAQRVDEPPRIYDEVAPSLLQRMGTGGNQMPLVAHPELVVRRLTPLECERLQGWPDDHTLLRADGKEQSDTPRYKQIGNGVAAPVAEWVARQIIDASTSQNPRTA